MTFPPRLDNCRPGSLDRGTHDLPGTGSDVQVEAGVDNAEVVAGQLADPAQPVAQRASVDQQRVRGRVIVARALVVLPESVQQVAVVGLVIVDEGAEPFPDELVDARLLSSLPSTR
jgi:hypothetical protein